MNQITEAVKTTFIRPDLLEGETYAGAIINPDGIGHHIILLAGDKDMVTWQDAMDWARELGGDLPNRIEQALLFATNKDQFKPRWYWSNTQHASSSDFAWSQHFYYGDQFSFSKLNEFRARAVRRLPI